MSAVKSYSFTAVDAVREHILVRAGFCGTTGSGKSYTALLLAARMVDRMPGLGPVYVIDTEHGSALRYAYSPRSRQGFRFKHVPMQEDDFSPAAYLAAIEFCEAQGAGVIVIDSLSHMWNGIGGVLEQVDKTTEASRTRNTFSEGWKTWTPIHTRAIERVMQSRAHVLFTLRAKTDWVVVENDRGKKEPKKMGLAPVAREGIDYEPDLFFVMEAEGKNTVLWVDKSRALDRPDLARGARHVNPGDAWAEDIIGWAEDGEPPEPAAPAWTEAALEEQLVASVAASTSAEALKSERARLASWMTERRVPRERGEQAQADLTRRVREAAERRRVPAAPIASPVSDEDRVRAIDQGRA